MRLGGRGRETRERLASPEGSERGRDAVSRDDEAATGAEPADKYPDHAAVQVEVWATRVAPVDPAVGQERVGCRGQDRAEADRGLDTLLESSKVRR